MIRRNIYGVSTVKAQLSEWRSLDEVFVIEFCPQPMDDTHVMCSVDYEARDPRYMLSVQNTILCGLSCFPRENRDFRYLINICESSRALIASQTVLSIVI